MASYEVKGRRRSSILPIVQADTNAHDDHEEFIKPLEHPTYSRRRYLWLAWFLVMIGVTILGMRKMSSLMIKFDAKVERSGGKQSKDIPVEQLEIMNKRLKAIRQKYDAKQNTTELEPKQVVADDLGAENEPVDEPNSHHGQVSQGDADTKKEDINSPQMRWITPNDMVSDTMDTNVLEDRKFDGEELPEAGVEGNQTVRVLPFAFVNRSPTDHKELKPDADAIEKTTVSPTTEYVEENAARETVATESDNVAKVSDVSKTELEKGLADVAPDLSIWLQADAGVQVEDMRKCQALGDGCEVHSWSNQVAPLTSFVAVEKGSRPLLMPNDNDQLPSILFRCPMQSANLGLSQETTIFVVVAPPNDYNPSAWSSQKLFGYSPNGQFLLHGNNQPAFYTSPTLQLADVSLPVGRFSLLAYRLSKDDLTIRVNQQDVLTSSTEELVDMDTFGPLALGNAETVCDSSSFQGRIAELLVYESAFDTDQIDKVETYLRQKWWKNDFQSLQTTSPDPNEMPPPETSTFDPDHIFEWTPPSKPASAASTWNLRVKQSIQAIENYHLGGQALRRFIHDEKQQLLSLYQQLYGSEVVKTRRLL